MADNVTISRQILDQRLDGLRGVPATPVRGWIRAIRDALGMTTTDLAARMGTTKQAVSGLERSEADGSIRLETLRRAAAALDCTLVYALVPNEPLEEIVDRQAHRIAASDFARVRQTMLLEDQLVEDSRVEQQLVDKLAEEIKSSRRLWRS